MVAHRHEDLAIARAEDAAQPRENSSEGRRVALCDPARKEHVEHRQPREDVPLIQPTSLEVAEQAEIVINTGRFEAEASQSGLERVHQGRCAGHVVARRHVDLAIAHA